MFGLSELGWTVASTRYENILLEPQEYKGTRASVVANVFVSWCHCTCHRKLPHTLAGKTTLANGPS